VYRLYKTHFRTFCGFILAAFFEIFAIDLPKVSIRPDSTPELAFCAPGRRIENLKQLLLFCSNPAALRRVDSADADILDG
jgi:hypothetical protein